MPQPCFSPKDLFQWIWGDEPGGSVHTVSVHTSSLRKKLRMDEAGNPVIKNRRNEGFYLDLES
ncbi:helix-turn-helix domain-containing protein [Ruminococcaceae bacterium OttesenSCG-928-L11]|nr:helix-turn-helix domain-containing protein [Ruminococcaceae bacterium OttesenSCG-928-L11]